MRSSKLANATTTYSNDGAPAASGEFPHRACDDLGVGAAGRSGGVTWFSGKEASMIGRIVMVRRAPSLALTATAALLVALFDCNPVFAQVGGMGSPTPGISATSPFGMSPGSPIPPPGIPLGSTELASPGLSPPPTGLTGTTGSGGACSALGSPSSGMSSSGISGSSTLFDGGGMAAGSSLPGSAAGISGTGC